MNRPASVSPQLLWGASVICAVLTLASLLLPVAVPQLYRSTSAWPGYYTLITPLSADEATSRLEAAGLTGVISAVNQTVALTRFSRIEQIPVAALEERLDPADPRRDTYIDGVASYFRATDGEEVYAILYLPQRVGAATMSRRVRAALGGDAVLLDWRVLPVITSLIVFGTAVGFTVVRVFRRRSAVPLERGVVVSGVLAWIPFVALGGVAAAAVAAALFFLWSTITAELLEAVRYRCNYGRMPLRQLLPRGVWFSVSLAASFGYSMMVGASANLLPLAIAAAGAIGVAGLGSLAAILRFQEQDHRLFMPVSLSHSSRSMLSAPILALLVLLLPPIAARTGGRAPVEVPRPLTVAGRYDLTFDDLALLYASDDGSDLPTFADYVAHVANQEALLYGWDSVFPQRGQEVLLTRYREDESGAYHPFEETVLVFDDQWLNRVTSEAGLPRVLQVGGRATGVVLTQMSELYSNYPQIVQHSVFVFLVFGPFLLGGVGFARKTSLLGPIKRRRQVA